MIYLNNHLSSNPVEIPVTLPPIACHEIHKQFTKIVIIWGFKKIQSSNVLQIFGKFFCNTQDFEITIIAVLSNTTESERPVSLKGEKKLQFKFFNKISDPLIIINQSLIYFVFEAAFPQQFCILSAVTTEDKNRSKKINQTGQWTLPIITISDITEIEAGFL